MIELQRRLLGDKVRNDAFAAALKRVIEPGKSVVADLGSGTGFLSFLALKLGAKECYLYEHSPVIELSKKLAKENGLKNLHFIPKTTIMVKKPVLADIVISETLGNHALEEDMLQTLNDAPRFLKPGGVMIPQTLEQFVAPVFKPRLLEDVNVWDRVGYGLSFRGIRDYALCNLYVRTMKPDELGPARSFDTIDLTQKNKLKRDGHAEWVCGDKQTIYGLALWWNCGLIKGVNISTAPDAPPTHWEQIFLPALEPIKLERGDKLSVTLTCQSSFEGGFYMSWKLAAERKGKVFGAQTLKTAPPSY